MHDVSVQKSRVQNVLSMMGPWTFFTEAVHENVGPSDAQKINYCKSVLVSRQTLKPTVQRGKSDEKGMEAKCTKPLRNFVQNFF